MMQRELLRKGMFLNRYKVTVTYEMTAHDEHSARSQADSLTRTTTKVEKTQDRSVPYRAYLQRMKDRGYT